MLLFAFLRQLTEHKGQRGGSVHCRLVGRVVAVVIVIDHQRILQIGVRVAISQMHTPERVEFVGSSATVVSTAFSSLISS